MVLHVNIWPVIQYSLNNCRVLSRESQVKRSPGILQCTPQRHTQASLYNQAPLSSRKHFSMSFIVYIYTHTNTYFMCDMAYIEQIHTGYLYTASGVQWAKILHTH